MCLYLYKVSWYTYTIILLPRIILPLSFWVISGLVASFLSIILTLICAILIVSFLFHHHIIILSNHIAALLLVLLNYPCLLSSLFCIQNLAPFSSGKIYLRSFLATRPLPLPPPSKLVCPSSSVICSTVIVLFQLPLHFISLQFHFLASFTC